jgi:hypothetical protein
MLTMIACPSPRNSAYSTATLTSKIAVLAATQPSLAGVSVKSLGKRNHLAVWRRSQHPGWMSVEAYKRYPVEMVMRECEVDGRVLGAKKRRSSLPILTVPRKAAREQQLAKREARRLNVAP